MARRRNRGRKLSVREILSIVIALFILAALYNAYKWYQENTELFWGAVAVTILGLAALFVLYRWFTSRRKRKVLADMPEKVKDIKKLLDDFVTDIPKFSKHSETSYQIDFGRYLKDRLPGDSVVYEETRDSVRPDIVINKTMAIEIKALKNPDTKENKTYNGQHIDSIFKKIHTYKVYDQVVIIIFNSEYGRDRGWRDYEKMKEAVKQQGVTLFEK